MTETIDKLRNKVAEQQKVIAELKAEAGAKVADVADRDAEIARLKRIIKHGSEENGGVSPSKMEALFAPGITRAQLAEILEAWKHKALKDLQGSLNGLRGEFSDQMTAMRRDCQAAKSIANETLQAVEVFTERDKNRRSRSQILLVLLEDDLLNDLEEKLQNERETTAKWFWEAPWFDRDDERTVKLLGSVGYAGEPFDKLWERAGEL